MENSMKKDRTLLFPFQGEGMGEGAKDFFRPAAVCTLQLARVFSNQVAAKKKELAYCMLHSVESLARSQKAG